MPEPLCIYGREHEYQFHPASKSRMIALCRFCYYSPSKPPRQKTTTNRPKSLKGAALVLRAQMEDVCAYCGVDLCDDTRSVDHVIPRVRGGMDHLSNYVLACRECNGSKGDKTVREWIGTDEPPFLHYKLSAYDIVSTHEDDSNIYHPGDRFSRL